MGSWDRKLDRAEEHLVALAKAIEAFIASEPYDVRRDLEADGADHVYRFSKYTTPPDEIALLVGDAAHNLRSSLDHVVFALAQEGVRRTGASWPKNAESTIQFPIATSAERFDEEVGRHRLRGVPYEARLIIERLQPYWLSPGQPSESWLSQLHALDIADKHRAITALGVVVSYIAYVAPSGAEQPQIFPNRNLEDWGEGVEIVRFRFQHPMPEVDLEFRPEFTVSAEDLWPPTYQADVNLRRFAQNIRDLVVEPLTPFLT